MERFDLSGKVAVISGGSRGIGEQIARAYADAGANVVVSSRKAETVEPVAEAINATAPGRARAVVAHAGDREQAQKLIAEAVNAYGGVDIVVNNAATNPHFGPILQAEPWQWDKILDVNVKGYFWLSQAGARQMQEQGRGGKIINMASITGLEPGMMMGIYSVSKAAVIMLTKVLALELAADDIQVNAIAPGFVQTRFSAALWQNEMLSKAIREKTPAGRMASTDELAGIALYLASPSSSFTTGAIFTVDGGFLLT